MLLRRFMQHVKEQNWFAVGLDVIVVIVGIFLGLQVQQRYEDHQFAVNEVVLLGKLKSEIETNNRLSTLRVNYMTKVRDSGERAVDFLDSGEPCRDNCWALLVDFFIASQSSPAPIVKNINEEMQRLGLPRRESIKESVDLYYVLSEGAYAAIDMTPKYRDLVRELMSSKSLKVLWEHCHAIDKKGLETLVVNCEQQLTDDEITDILEKLRANPMLENYLNHWVGMHYIWIPLFELQLKTGDEAIAIIDEFIN